MFRGPNASGVSETSHPPVEIGPGQNMAWHTAVPRSPSGPCLWNDRLFLTTFEDGKLETRCYATASGHLIWTQSLKPQQLEEFHPTDGSPASATPATDGKRVVSYFGSCGLVAYDFSGKELWRFPLPPAQTLGSYGSGTSPLLAGNLVILNRDMVKNSSLIAVNLETGKKEWETPRPEAVTSFGSPILWNNNGVEEIVTPGAFFLKGYDPKTGSERWVLGGVTHVACTTPVVGEGMLYFAGWAPGKADAPWPSWETFAADRDKDKDGKVTPEELGPETWSYMKALDFNHDGVFTAEDFKALESYTAKGENVLVAVKPGGKGEITQSHAAWKVKKGLPYVPSPVFYRGRVYTVKDGGLLSCYEGGTGAAIWEQERLPAAGRYYASPVAADGRIYLFSLEGKLTVLKAGTEKVEIVHQASFGERVESTPAIAANRIYVRTGSNLYAFAAATVPVAGGASPDGKPGL
jgi:outer membrane protein assembly factor BamB